MKTFLLSISIFITFLLVFAVCQGCEKKGVECEGGSCPILVKEIVLEGTQAQVSYNLDKIPNTKKYCRCKGCNCGR